MTATFNTPENRALVQRFIAMGKLRLGQMLPSGAVAGQPRTWRAKPKPIVRPARVVNGGGLCGVIVEMVERHFSIPPKILFRDDRSAGVSHARFIAFYLCREAGLSWGEIGKSFGRDHSGVIYACKKVKGWIEVDAKFRADLARIRKLLGVNGGDKTQNQL